MKTQPSLKKLPIKVPSERVMRDIRRQTRRHFSAEDKLRIALTACAARTASPSCAARKVLRRACITRGRSSSWKPASAGWPATLPVPRPAARSMTCAAKRAP